MKAPLVLVKFRSKLGVAVVAFAAGVLVAGGIVYAAIPDSQGVIHACFDRDGQLRVIDSPKKKCAKKETAISWNQKGLQGPVGPSGNTTLTCIACTTRDVLTRINKTSFVGVNLSFANLFGSELKGEDFSGSTFTNAILRGVQLHNTNFTNANLTKANLQSSGFVNSNLTNTNLTGADLSMTTFYGTDLTHANLTDVIWNYTACPDKTNSDDNGGTCIGHLVP